jgi:hypothetical protein
MRWTRTFSAAAPALVPALVLAVVVSAGEKYDPETLPRRGKDYYGGREFVKRFGDKQWEIKACFKHQDGNLGTYEVGDIIRVAFTIGVLGARDSANAKSFKAPVPVLHIIEKGKTKEVIPFEACAN